LLRISPSRYHAFKLCSLKEILLAGGQSALLPLSSAARIGTVVHTIMEFASAGRIHNEAQFNEIWQNEIKRIEAAMLSNPLERHLVPIEETADDYEVKKIMALNMIYSFHSLDSKRDTAKKGSWSEQWLETKDGKIGGKIDLIQDTPSGIVIIDYKTGNIFNAGTEQPKEEYQQQLKLYAALCFDKFNKWPEQLIIAGIDLATCEVKFSQSECIKLVEEAKKNLDDTNELISSGLAAEDFAIPSPAACRYCPFRPGCHKYWQARQDTEDWPIDIIGNVKERGFSGNKCGRIVVEKGDKKYIVRGLSQRHGFLNSDCNNVLVCNLGNDTSPGNYVEKRLTAGYGF
jgi:RecB family exonuclease